MVLKTQSDLIKAMRKVNKKHKSIKKSLIQLDSNELIRTGVIDFFMALGKNKEYATNDYKQQNIFKN